MVTKSQMLQINVRTLSLYVIFWLAKRFSKLEGF